MDALTLAVITMRTPEKPIGENRTLVPLDLPAKLVALMAEFQLPSPEAALGLIRFAMRRGALNSEWRGYEAFLRDMTEDQAQMLRHMMRQQLKRAP